MAQEIGKVASLWRYPVSSLGGEGLQAATVGHEGIAGDRTFGLVDLAAEAIARPDMEERWRPAPRIEARATPGGIPEVRLPEGRWLPADADELAPLLERHLGFPAALRPFENRVPAATGLFTQNRYRPKPIHLLTTASLARLKSLYPQGDAHPRRFRANILVEMPEAAGRFPETEWIGRSIVIGAVRLAIVEPCRRCGFTIIDQPGVPYDAGILRTLVRHNNHNIGVLCTVEATGDVSVGDGVGLLD